MGMHGQDRIGGGHAWVGSSRGGYAWGGTE